MPNFELNTTISSLRSLRESDLRAYDAIYLGNIYCRTFEDNLLERLDDLRQAVAEVKDRGLRAYVTSYGAPRNDALPKVQKALEAAASAGADAIEVHNLGVLRMVHEQFPGMPVHVGGFANVYTDAGASVLKEYGAVRFTPNYEISLDEVTAIAESASLPAEILVHGKMPLGISDYCFLLEYEHKWAEKCPTVCQKNLFLRQGDWAMKSVGKGVLSGKDVCMLEHLPALLSAGHRMFRIEAAYETAAYRSSIAEIYRAALEQTAAGDGAVNELSWHTVRQHTAVGLCNGFYFGRTGGEYVGSQGEAAEVCWVGTR
ncbi:MAG TPA: peptidase U32 family protein [Terriglobales bacterium]|jgi:putative protease|nr:peptidase U32 family protein [Terriglobales bacterium]